MSMFWADLFLFSAGAICGAGFAVAVIMWATGPEDWAPPHDARDQGDGSEFDQAIRRASLRDIRNAGL